MNTVNTLSKTWLKLTHLAALTVQGPDATTFLQGQLTYDVMQLAVGQSAMAAHCNHKGRTFANFHLHRHSEQSFLLVLPYSMCSPLQERLQKYAVFSKVEILNSADQYHFLGTNDLPYELNVNGSKTICISLPCTKRYLLLVDSKQLDDLTGQLLASNPPSSLEEWQLLNMQDKLIYIEPATALKFLPQMLNLTAFNAISFNKGCYVGQEIIARVHNLGILKQHLYYFTSSNNTLKVGDHVEQHDLTGEVVTSLTIANKTHVLAVMRQTT